jgi:3-dehydroquinate synthase
VEELCGGNAALIVADGNTERFASSVDPSGLVPRCILSAGEAFKGWAAVERILLGARDAGIGRRGLIVGVGGGVVTDMAGFAASIYMRGCGLVFVSTTLLGMADAAIGGKTAIDMDEVKNMAGTFYPASKVFMPLAALETLPAGEKKSGLAEMFKAAVIAGREDEFTNADISSPAWLLSAVNMAVELKCRVVEEDPFEKLGVRAALNLGHTFAHALESAAGFGKISHGEAVAWGLSRAAALGEAHGITPKIRAEKIRSTLNTLGYETSPIHPLLERAGAIDNFYTALKSDKKNGDGKLNFIVPNEASVETLPIPIDSFRL